MCRAENRTDKNSHKAEMRFHGEIIGTLIKLVRPLCLMRILFANCSILFCSKIILNLSLLLFFHVELISTAAPSSLSLLSPRGLESLPSLCIPKFSKI